MTPTERRSADRSPKRSCGRFSRSLIPSGAGWSWLPPIPGCVLTASKVEPATRAAAMTRLTQSAARLERRGSAGWTGARAARGRRPGESIVIPAAGSRRRCDGRGPRRVPLEVALAFHPETLGQLLFVRIEPSPRRSHRPVPRRGDHRHPPRQERELPVGAHAEHVQHGSALRPRVRGAHGVRLAPA